MLRCLPKVFRMRSKLPGTLSSSGPVQIPHFFIGDHHDFNTFILHARCMPCHPLHGGCSLVLQCLCTVVFLSLEGSGSCKMANLWSSRKGVMMYYQDGKHPLHVKSPLVQRSSGISGAPETFWCFLAFLTPQAHAHTWQQPYPSSS